jgi:hypothetical protein
MPAPSILLVEFARDSAKSHLVVLASFEEVELLAGGQGTLGEQGYEHFAGYRVSAVGGSLRERVASRSGSAHGRDGRCVRRRTPAGHLVGVDLSRRADAPGPKPSLLATGSA